MKSNKSERDAKQTHRKSRFDYKVSYIITKISTDKSECSEGIISDLYILKRSQDRVNSFLRLYSPLRRVVLCRSMIHFNVVEDFLVN